MNATNRLPSLDTFRTFGARYADRSNQSNFFQTKGVRAELALPSRLGRRPGYITNCGVSVWWIADPPIPLLPGTPLLANFRVPTMEKTERPAGRTWQRCRIKSRCTFPQPLRSRPKSRRPSLASSNPSGRTWCGFATKSVRIGAASGPSSSALYSPMMLPGTAYGTLRRGSFGDWLNDWISPAWACFPTTTSEVCPNSRCCRNPRGPSGRTLRRRAFFWLTRGSRTNVRH